MMSNEQWTLIVSVGTFIVGCMVLGALLWWRHHLLAIQDAVNRGPVLPEIPDNTEVVLDAIDGVRDQVDSHGMHTQTEHDGMNKKLDLIGGRVQFLVAEDISGLLSEQRIREAKVRKAAEPKPDETQEGG